MMLADSGSFASAPSPSPWRQAFKRSWLWPYPRLLSALGFYSVLCTLVPFSRAEGYTEMWELVCVRSEPQGWQHTWRPQATEQVWLHSLLNLPQISSSPDPSLTSG